MSGISFSVFVLAETAAYFLLDFAHFQFDSQRPTKHCSCGIKPLPAVQFLNNSLVVVIIEKSRPTYLRVSRANEAVQKIQVALEP